MHLDQSPESSGTEPFQQKILLWDVYATERKS